MQNIFKNTQEPLRIVLASDHRGVDKRLALIDSLKQMDPQINIIDLGTHDSEQKVDALDYGSKAAEHVLSGEADCAILMCGSGVIVTAGAFITGMTKGIMAVQVSDAEQAARFRQHQNGRMIGLGADFMNDAQILDTVKAFLSTETEVGTGGKERYQRRLDEMHEFYLNTVKQELEAA